MQQVTALTQLKEKLQVVVDSLEAAVHGTDQYGYRAAMENVIKDIDAQMLEVEKQQIIDAFDEGADRNIPIEGQQYFKQTFKQVTN